MKNPEWVKKIPDGFHAVRQEAQYDPGCRGLAIHKRTGIDVTLEIIEAQAGQDEQNVSLYIAKVIHFNDPKKILTEIEAGDEVEVGIQHFLPE